MSPKRQAKHDAIKASLLKRRIRMRQRAGRKVLKLTGNMVTVQSSPEMFA